MPAMLVYTRAGAKPILQDVDRSSGVAGVTDCIECGGDGNWGKFAPEIVGPDFKCVTCKGTGKILVSI